MCGFAGWRRPARLGLDEDAFAHATAREASGIYIVAAMQENGGFCAVSGHVLAASDIWRPIVVIPCGGYI
jgi:hypothetical protein